MHFIRNQKFDKKSSFFNNQNVDTYSLGMILWELDTGEKPFKNEKASSVFHLLMNEKLRPKIPESTNKNLALLIRRCWQDCAEKRPSYNKIIESVNDVEFN